MLPMGAIKTLADVTWKEGPSPRNTSVRGVTDKIDELLADKTGTATISGTWTFTAPFVLPSYTVATLPSAATAAQLIYVSDEAGGAIPAFSDGTDWRRVTDRAVVS